MIALVASTQSITVKTGATATTTAPTVLVSGRLVRFGTQQGQQGQNLPAAFLQVTATTGTTAVTVTPAVPSGFYLAIDNIQIANVDTVTATFTTTFVDSNGSVSLIFLPAKAMATLELLQYESGQGWYGLTAAGAIKNST